MLSRSIVISHRRHRARWTSTASPCSRFFSADSTIKSSSDDGSFKQGLSRLFTDEQRELLKQAHKLSSMSRSLAKQVGNVKIREESLLVDIAKCLQEGREEKLETSEDVIPSLFTVVFAGEFNSGKSTLINALCGNKELLESGVLPTTDKITVLMASEVLVINKIDILERRQGDDHGQETKQKMVDYVQEHASDLLGASPIVIPVSGRDALSWKQLNRSSNNSNLWTRSNFGQLETFLSATLTASSKIKTKLSNPLGVAEGILLDCKHEIERRQEDLDVDVATLKLLRSDSEAFEKDMTSILDRHRSNINKEWTTRAQVVQRVLDELTLVDQLRIGIGMGRNTFDRAWENANMTHIINSQRVFVFLKQTDINNI
ncbi:mitofusin [Skeletonema marinoi]|uniref:Mitofusin n=2 Tax=Skeletonema marinoi TaxID=267567 RepID=A0AAD8YFY8_9STRA|nr:mitofusin [Skeletonema marinoi]